MVDFSKMVRNARHQWLSAVVAACPSTATFNALVCEGSNVAENAAHEEALLEKRNFYFDHYKKMSAQISELFKERDYHRSQAFFDVMLELTRFKDVETALDYERAHVRKNGYMPGAAHEMGLLIPLIATMVNDHDFIDLLPDIEQAYGSIEVFICAIIVHDMGEEKNWFAKDIEKRFLDKLQDNGVEITDDVLEFSKRVGQAMERLTDCRDLSPAEVLDITGIEIDLSHVQPSDALSMGDFEGPLKEKIWPLMDKLPDHGRENFQVFAYCDPRKTKPVLRVTRYGATKEDEPVQDYSLDTSLYHEVVCMRAFVKLTKKLDTINNLMTLIDKGDDAMKMRVYLDNKRDAWEEMGPVNSIAEDSPLYEFSQSLNRQMDILSRLLDLHIMGLDQSENYGGKNPNPTKEHDYSDCFPQCEYAFKHVGFLNDPICTILMQIYTAPNTSRVKNSTAIYDAVIRDIRTVCSASMAAKLDDMHAYLEEHAKLAPIDYSIGDQPDSEFAQIAENWVISERDAPHI